MKEFRNPYWASEITTILEVGMSMSAILERGGMVTDYFTSSVDTADSEQGKSVDKEILEVVKLAGEHAEQRAREMFLGQMIVLLVTYMELMIREYFQVLFTRHPMRMYGFLVASGGGCSLEGKVDLRKIVNAESMDDLICQLAEMAASTATSGGYQAVFRRLEKSSKAELRPELKDNLLSLVDFRNKVVHEANREDDDSRHFIEGTVAVMDLLKSLLDWCKVNNLPHGAAKMFGPPSDLDSN